MSSHWDTFYRSGRVPSIPSQFCVFVANEFPDVPNIVEVGCGNGRDARFFSQNGRRTIAFDASRSAIEACQQHAADESILFLQGEAHHSSTWQQVRAALARAPGPVLIYARFFLHAIDEQTEAGFLHEARDLLAERGGHFCVEFRTVRDSDHAKVTPDHFRRFIEPLHLAARLGKQGLSVDYFAEGYGMAKYRADDAHVARLIAS